MPFLTDKPRKQKMKYFLLHHSKNKKCVFYSQCPEKTYTSLESVNLKEMD